MLNLQFHQKRITSDSLPTGEDSSPCNAGTQAVKKTKITRSTHARGSGQWHACKAPPSCGPVPPHDPPKV